MKKGQEIPIACKDMEQWELRTRLAGMSPSVVTFQD